MALCKQRCSGPSFLKLPLCLPNDPSMQTSNFIPDTFIPLPAPSLTVALQITSYHPHYFELQPLKLTSFPNRVSSEMWMVPRITTEQQNPPSFLRSDTTDGTPSRNSMSQI